MNRSADKDRRRRHRLAKRRQHQPGPSYEDAPLGEITDLLATGEPLDLLGHVSGLMYVSDDPNPPAGRTPWSRPDPDAEVLTRTELLAALIGIDRRETTALLTAWRWLTASDFEARMLATTLAQRTHQMPTWLATLGEVRVGGLSMLTDEFGDGDGYSIELRWPDGTSVTLVALVDANIGHALTGGFAFGGPASRIETILNDAGGTRLCEVDPADARARLTEGIEHSAILYPPVETDSWPMMRPLLERALRLLPTGGRGHLIHEFDPEEAARIGADFAASLDADGATTLDAGGETRALAASIAEDLVWFAQFNCGDPFRWSPTKVDQLMTDWWARKVVTTPDVDEAMPDVLARFVRYCAARKGLSEAGLQQILDSIDECRPDYMESITSPRMDTASMLAQIAAGLPIAPGRQIEGPMEGLENPLELLAARIGGRDVLDGLDTEPLPLADFDWTGIPPEAAPKVQATLALLDGQADDFFGPEFGAACRLVLARLASAQPGLFVRKASDATAACAIAYLVADTNNLIGPWAYTGTALAQRFGVNGMPTSRVQTFRTALFNSGWRGHRGVVAEPGLLTSDSRGQLIAMRDIWGTLSFS